jgi:hypothetical protein
MDKPAPHITLKMRSVNSVVLSGVVVAPVRINEDGSGSFVLRTGISEQRQGGGGWVIVEHDVYVAITNPKVAEKQRSALIEGKLVTIQGAIGQGGWVLAQHIEWNGTHEAVRQGYSAAPSGGAPAGGSGGNNGREWQW